MRPAERQWAPTKKKAIGCLWLTTHCLCGKLACVSVEGRKGEGIIVTFLRGLTPAEHPARTLAL